MWLWAVRRIKNYSGTVVTVDWAEGGSLILFMRNFSQTIRSASNSVSTAATAARFQGVICNFWLAALLKKAGLMRYEQARGQTAEMESSEEEEEIREQLFSWRPWWTLNNNQHFWSIFVSLCLFVKLNELKLTSAQFMVFNWAVELTWPWSQSGW